MSDTTAKADAATETGLDRTTHATQGGPSCTCLLVLGMHRSGTSALTRILSLLGAALPEHMLGAGVGNETGHWEPQKLVELHDRMLAEAGSSWDDWRQFTFAGLAPERQDHYCAALRDVIAEDYGDASLFVLKDPRVCRFVPLYREVLADLGVAVRPVLTYRNPLSVAKSLQARNEIPSALTMVYWLRHVLDAEVTTRDLPRAVFSYESLLADWRKTIDPLATQLGLEWPRQPGDAAAEIDGFLSPAHQHHTTIAEEFWGDETIPRWVVRTYAALQRLEHDPSAGRADLDEIRQAFEGASDLLGSALTNFRTHSSIELAQLQNETEALKAQLSAALSEQQELAAQLARAENDLTKEKKSVKDLEDRTRQAHQQSLQKSVAVRALLDNKKQRPSASRSVDLIAQLLSPATFDVTELIAANDIEPNGLLHGWRCTGNDPQLLVPLAIDARFVRVKFRAKILNVDNRFISRWQLFYGSADGFYEDRCHSQEFVGSDIEVDQILNFKFPPVALRLDPTDCPCEFILQEFQITQLDTRTTQMSLAFQRTRRFFARDSLPNQLKKIAYEVRRGRTGHLLRRLFEPERFSLEVYQKWVVQRAVSADAARNFTVKASEFAIQPLFSIIMPTYNSPPEFLRKAIDSVRSQTYGNWELMITDDGSTQKDHFPILKELSAADERIKLQYAGKNGGISAASNNALSRAKGDYVVLFDHDDELQPHALHAYVEAINKNPEADWLYSDEDKINEKGQRFGPYFKPDWSPAFFLSCMYTCHLGVYRRSMVDELGGFRPDFDMAQDYDLALRFASRTKNIVHIPDILYHWRTLPQSTASSASAKPIAEMRARSAVQSFIDRGKYPGKALPGYLPGTHRVTFELLAKPLVSIAIPSAGRRSHVEGRDSWLVLDLVKSIRSLSTYPNIEIVIAENGDFDPRLTEALRPYDIKLVLYEAETFNIADKMNLVVQATSGEYVVILNDDMEIITPGWIEEMLMWAQQDDVCGVGARLLFPDGRIQHAGVLLLGQGPSHVYYLEPQSTIGLAGNAQAVHECLAVTGACMLMRRADYLAIGGFDPAFRINYNDVDFCLRLIEHTGGRILFTPFAELYHYESVSREAAPPIELPTFNEKWKKYMGADPYYNHHLSQSSNAYELSSVVVPLEADYRLSD